MTPLLRLRKPKVILFDLDGTLADSAPDLTAAINNVRLEFHLEKLPYETLRPYASAGAPGLVKAAFQILKENLTGDTISLCCFFKHITELTL